jgi:hypothetical protein
MNLPQINNWLTSENQDGSRVSRILLLSALAIFVVMAGMAWVLYKERMLNFDPVFFTFLMLQEEWFSPVLGRYGTILSQLLPFTLMKFGANLETILKVYSLSFVLLYITYLLIIAKGFKDRAGVIALCIALTLTFRQTFYYATAELYQAIGLSVVLWSLFRFTLDSQGIKHKVGLFGCALLIVSISFFHQLGLFTVVFVLGAEYARRQELKNYPALGVIAFAFLWFVFRIKFLTVSSYEQEKLLTPQSFVHYLTKLKELESYTYFLKFFKDHLWVSVIAGITGFVALLLQRKWLVSLFIPLFILAFWLVIITGMNRHESPIMFQNYYTVFGLFIGVLLAIAFEKSNVWLVTIMVFGLSFYSLKEIYQSRHDYRVRTEFITQLCEYGQQLPEGKYVINANYLPWEFVWISWALPFETMLSSEINPNQQSVSFYPTFEPDTLKDFDIVRAESFLGANFGPHWHGTNALNPKYFDLKEGPYQIINTLQNEELFTDSFLNQDAIKIIPEKLELTQFAGYNSTKITIHNQSTLLFGSIPHKKWGISMYCTIISEKGDTISHQARDLFIDVPANGKMTQTLTYMHPPGNGSRMELGFYLKKNNSYHPKTSIRLNVH